MLLEAANLTKSYGGVPALRNVSFALERGEIHALVGENGAGKSTLIKILTGAVAADGGHLRLDDSPIERHSPAQARALGIAAIYQQPQLFPDLTVEENIGLTVERGGLWRRVPWVERRARTRSLLASLGAEIDPGAPVQVLSLPEQQLVEIARALGTGARVLILDEPTASLTDREVDRLFAALRRLRSEGVGMIYVSHRLEELPQIADRVTVLRDGTLVETRPMDGVSREMLIRLMVGREVATLFPKREVPIGAPVLEVRDLACHATGVHGVSFTLHAGEILGLAGLVGSGRTELAETLFGLRPFDAGTLHLSGRGVRPTSPGEAVQLGIAYVPEDRRRHGILGDFSVAANATLATLAIRPGWNLLRPGSERALARDYQQRLQLKAASVIAPASSLSGGNQQKVSMSRWLATRPSVLILDEPTQGVDVGAKAEIHRLMGDLAADGLAILMISSELPEVLAMSDRLAVMRAGTIAGVLDRAAATPERVLAMALGEVAA